MSTVFVTLCDSAYHSKAVQTIEELRKIGKWSGDIVMITVDFRPESIYDCAVFAVEHIDTSSLLAEYAKFPIDSGDDRHMKKLYQWDKFYVFADYFRKWKRVVFLDAGMRILDTVSPLLELPYEGKFLAPDDSDPYDNGRRFRIQFDLVGNPDARDRLFQEYPQSVFDEKYFLNCVFVYDTSILDVVTIDDLVRAMDEYPIAKCNEMTIINLLITMKHRLWVPFPQKVGTKYLFGWNEQNYNGPVEWSMFHMMKYSSKAPARFNYEQYEIHRKLIELRFLERCLWSSDIHEHIPTLAAYASICNHITECGTRTAVSSYALALGLLGNPNGKLIQVDIASTPDSNAFQNDCKSQNIQSIFYEQSDLECPIEPTDLLFIDTWHVYGQLTRELARWHSYVRKFILLHDTEVDKWFGESIRCGCSISEQSSQSGIPVGEIQRGLWPAVVEFLRDHPEWVIERQFTNCNGLTVLRRVPPRSEYTSSGIRE